MRADLAVLKSNENFSATFTTSVSGDITMSYGDFASETSNTPSHTYALLPPYLLNVKNLSVPHSAITGIDLSTNNLTAVDVSRFKNLTTLDVSNNLLTLKEISKILIELDSMGQENGTLTLTGNISGSITSEAYIALTNLLSKGWVSDEYYGQWTPESISTNAWFDASDDSTVIFRPSTTFVQGWLDKSDNGNDAEQLTATQQPTWNSSDSKMNNMPSIGITSSSVHKGLFTPSMSAKRCYVIVRCNTTTFDTFNVMFGSTGGTGSYLVRGARDGTEFETFGSYEFNDLGAYKNGSTTNTPLGALPMTNATMFKFDSSVDRVQPYYFGYSPYWPNGRAWNGSYSEFIYTDGTEDLATQQKIEGYLAHKWGITLASGHPYETSAP
jgi:hypothetical protein